MFQQLLQQLPHLLFLRLILPHHPPPSLPLSATTTTMESTLSTKADSEATTGDVAATEANAAEAARISAALQLLRRLLHPPTDLNHQSQQVFADGTVCSATKAGSV